MDTDPAERGRTYATAVVTNIKHCQQAVIRTGPQAVTSEWAFVHHS